MTKSESSSVAKTRFYAEGNQLPKCCHVGCNNDVAVREWKYWSFKGECGRCINARKKGIEVEGVTNIKKKYCENIDGQLEFTCLVKNKEDWKDYQESLHLDHFDGDHANNNPENLKTYCALCHSRKSKEDGDWSSHRDSRRNIG